MEQDLNYAARIAEKQEQHPFMNQTELVYSILLDDVLLKYRKPGSKINQDQLATLLGVSRTPVRDAINQLIEDDVLIRRGRGGYYVYILTMKDVMHIVEFRTAIEVQAGQLAIRRASGHDLALMRQNLAALSACDKADLKRMVDLDTEFHNLLVACSKNKLLIRAYQQCATQIQLLRNLSLTEQMYDNIVVRHKNILSALEVKDAERTVAAIRVHLRNNPDDSSEAMEYSYE
nr:GntR family transcriptional regulator [uncultured Oscillibacter sp.]